LLTYLSLNHKTKADESMQCPFCAEEIQDDAVLCRFCSAVKIDGQWKHKATTPKKPKGSIFGVDFTMRFAGFFFLLSALFAAMSFSSPVPLFGDVRTGVVAVAYHLMYVAVFAAMGVALWSAKSWGFRAMCVGTAIYTVDRLLYIFDSKARAAEVKSSMEGIGDLQGLLGPDLQSSISQIINLATLISIACWLGFLAYVYIHRDYFQSSEE